MSSSAAWAKAFPAPTAQLERLAAITPRHPPMPRVAPLLAAAACVLVIGCTSLRAIPGSAELRPEDRSAMLATLSASTDSWNRGDLAGHLALYDPAVTWMTEDGIKPGIAAIESVYSKNYFKDGKPRRNLRMEQVTVRALSERSALMTARFVLFGDQNPEQSGWVTLVWVRTNAGWKVVHDHSS